MYAPMEFTAAVTLISLGCVLLAAYGAHVVGAKTHVPRVTLLLLLGIAAGPLGLNLVSPTLERGFPLVTAMTLAVVGFLLGERFFGPELKRTGRTVVWVSIGVTAATAVLVSGTLLIAGAPLIVALVVAGIAPATAPAATVDIVREAGAKGPLTSVVLGVVALDDVLGVMLFSLMLVIAETVTRAGALDGVGAEVLLGLWEIFGAALLGVLFGLPMAALTGRLRRGEPAIAEVTGFVLLCAGVASAIGASYLLACMVLGATVANRARHHTRPFHTIEGVADPFLAIFFVLAGVQFEPISLGGLGLIALLYVVARTLGRVIGGQIGGRIAKAGHTIQTRVGWCLLPQAGVSIGLALIAANRLPEVGDAILSLILSTTVFFEVVAPIFTCSQLARAGEVAREG